MEVHLLTYMLDTGLRINPPDPVELVALVDGTMFRAAIEWSAVDRLRRADEAGHADEASVREVIHRNRRRIELAIEAHIYANGFPLDRRVVISPHELRVNGPMLRTGAAAGDDCCTHA
jgi:hypothetical protein